MILQQQPRNWTCQLASGLATAMLAMGCILPISTRSIGLGETARSPSVGDVEMGGAIAGAYAWDTNRITSVTEATRSTSSFSLPVFEGYLEYGASERLALSVRASGGGVQPGVKIKGSRSGWSFALLPSIGFGALFGTGDTSRPDATIIGLNLQGGAHFLCAKTLGNGLFAGLGYDYHALLIFGALGTPGALINLVGEHTVTARAGYAFETRLLTFKPELAVLYVPAKNYREGLLDRPPAKWSGGWSISGLIALSISLASDQLSRTQGQSSQ